MILNLIRYRHKQREKAQLVEYLPQKHEDVSLIPIIYIKIKACMGATAA